MNKTMLLRQKDKKAIKEIAKLTLKTQSEIWAYGSRVNGDAHDTSDLDLVIVTENKKPLEIDELLDFRENLSKSNIPIIIQVLDWERIPKSFQKNILNNYESLHKNYQTSLS